ncbi:hypothetical protein ACQPYH_14640 [Kribbella sp. CA-245084]|uniref:hypothetical protein n=1 Tax=Kribbella sp. CA-245084 TaxID=3239940 RepID=UPI003D92EEC9
MSFPGIWALSPTKPNLGQWYHLATKSACALGSSSTGNTDAEVRTVYESGRQKGFGMRSQGATPILVGTDQGR